MQFAPLLNRPAKQDADKIDRLQALDGNMFDPLYTQPV